MMKKLTFVIFFFFGFLFFTSFSFAQEEAGTAPTLPQPTQFQPDSEKEMMQKAVERLMPNALSGQSACTFWDQVKGKIFGDFACDSQNYQNIMMPSQTTAAGEVVGKVEGATDSAVLGIKEEGEVKGISIPLIGDLIGFINSILGGKQSGGAFYIYRADELKDLTIKLGTFGTKEIFGKTEKTLLPNSKNIDQGKITETPSVPTTPYPTGASSYPPLGTCTYGRDYCSVEYLRAYFPTLGAAQRASIICNRESGGNPFAQNKSCLTGGTDYSLGLFQFNQLAHCSSDLLARFSSSNYSGAGFNARSIFQYIRDYPASPCQILNQSVLNMCEEAMMNPDYNIKKAVDLSENGTSWYHWRAPNSSCNVPDGDYPLEIIGGKKEEITPPTDIQPAVNCPSINEKITVLDSTYLHLNRQDDCIQPSMIVLHWSGGWSSAQATFNTLNTRDLSCQFALDTETNLQMLDFFSGQAQKGMCVGGIFNDLAINFEITGAFFDDVLSNPEDAHYQTLMEETNEALKFTCHLLKYYNIDKSKIYGHYQLTWGKPDPGPNYLKYFKERVNNECN